jgi:1,4-dihydroxy-2-naphthoyl-CoA hydrolase
MNEPADFTSFLNETLSGWNRAVGLCFVSASADEVIAELELGDHHLQPYGIVHGGVHAGVIETTCSVGAAVFAGRNGQSVVGLENHTSFLRAVRGGKLRVTARPLQRGRRAQVWEGAVHDDAGRLVAAGRVRLLCLDSGAELAGEKVGV